MDVGGIYGKGGGKHGKVAAAGTVCKICNKTGHSAHQCWHKDGAPPKGKQDQKGGKKGGKKGDKNKGKATWKFEGECRWCKKTGRMEKDCRIKQSGGPEVGGVSADNFCTESSASTSMVSTKDCGMRWHPRG